jgi:hypothetical protein
MSFVEKALPELSDTDLDRLLRIHFIMTRTDAGEIGVIDFVRELPGRLQRIRTTVEPTTHRYEGEIHGRVQWNRTFAERCARSGAGSCLFVCDEIERNYETAENLVLKVIIEIIVGIVRQDLAKEFQTTAPSWLGEWAPNAPMRQEFLAASSRNVYLRRIEGSADRISDAMIARALRSRLPLYRDAAALLARYRRLMRHDLDPAEARRLLAITFIQPGRIEVLFELYWVLRIVQAFRRHSPEIRMHPIHYETGPVAQWTLKGDRFELFHNSTGMHTLFESARDARQTLTSLDNYFGRTIASRSMYQRLIGGGSDSLWEGRPDIVIRVTRADGRRHLLIGEVKYTRDPGYAKQGLRELLDYVYLVREREYEQYVAPYEDGLFDTSDIIGCLFSDRIDSRLFEDSETIRHLIYGEGMDSIDALVSSLIAPVSAEHEEPISTREINSKNN